MIRSDDDENALDSAKPGDGAVPAASADTDASSTVYLVPSELIQDTPAPVVVPPLPPSLPPPTPHFPPTPPRAPAVPPMPKPSAMPVLATGKTALARHLAPPTPTGPEEEADTSSLDQILMDAKRRLAHLPKSDKAKLARAHLEHGLLLETRKGDATAALEAYQAAEKAQEGFLPAIAAVRRLMPSKPLSAVLAQVEAEARATTHPGRRAARLFELARWQSTGGAPLAERACQTYRETLELFPRHPGALRGLETALRQVPLAVETSDGLTSLDSHLQTMANHFRSDPALAAWLNVERGHCLEKLRQGPAATVAFETALGLDGQLGPVRTAYTEHLAREGHVEALAKAWASEADLETDHARAARLFYLAGRLCSERLDQKSQAIALHERAQGLAAAAPFTRQAALRELVDLYDAQLPAQVATMQTLLPLATESEQPYWHRRLAKGFLALGKHADVAAHARMALDHAPGDEALRALLDQALATLGQHEQRVALFTSLSARESHPGARVHLLLRASQIAEREVGRTDLALVALRAALAIDPSHADTLDALSRLLVSASPPPSTLPEDPSHVRARIDFHIEAAAAVPDLPRKVAHLEALARIWEDEIRDPATAAAVWEEILSLEPQRRGAMVGLARAAGRAGDDRLVIRALKLEAAETKDPALERSLLLRTAAIAGDRLGDHAAALDLLSKVTGPKHTDAVALRMRFQAHEKAAHLDEALATLRHLLDLHRADDAGFDLHIEIAYFLEEKLRRPAEAMAAFRSAHALSPQNPLPREELRRLYLSQKDYAGLAAEFAKLAAATVDPLVQGDLYFQAAQLFDDRLGDLSQAIPLFLAAHALAPDEPLLIDRLEQAYLRHGKPAERLALLEKHEPTSPAARFQLAFLLKESTEPQKAYKRLASLTRDGAAGVAALRTLEQALRAAGRFDDLAVVLRKQVEGFATHEAQLGSLHELVALEEFHGAAVPAGKTRAVDVLAARDPGDLFIHELVLRKAGLSANSEAGMLIPALRALASSEEAMASAYFHLACGLLLDQAAGGDPDLLSEALRCYRATLSTWPESLSAGRAGRRLALAQVHREAQLAACVALGEHELDGKARSRRLLEAAQTALGMGGPTSLAMTYVCRALGQDPNSHRAADGVLSAIAHGLDAGKAVEILRKALDLTNSPEQAVRLGAALSHVAAHYLGDHTVAIEALRRARKRAPNHAGTLMALAEVSLALGLSTEAVEAASAGLAATRDPAERVRGLITLAEVHARTPSVRSTARREANEACQLVEQTNLANPSALARLGTVLHALGEEEKAAPILVRAVVFADDDRTTLDQLLALHGPDAAEKTARLLAQVLSLASQLGRPLRPEWLSALGQLEATSLGRPKDGLARLREAIRNAPGNPASWDALQAAHGENQGEAVVDLLALLPSLGAIKPSADQVIPVLRVLARALQKGPRPALAKACEDLASYLETGERPKETLPVSVPQPQVLTRDILRTVLLADAPGVGLLEAATALAEMAYKLARTEADHQTLRGRDRLAARSTHPARAIAERVGKAFGSPPFDLYDGLPDLGPPRILAGDPCAILLPAGFLDQQAPDQLAGLARVFTLAALDVPFLDHLAPGDAEGLLLGALRVGNPRFGQGVLPPEAERTADAYKTRIAKLGGRKLKRTLEDLAQRVSAPPDAMGLFDHLRAAGLGAAYVVSGDLTAALALATRDPRLGLSTDSLATALFAHPGLLMLLRLAFSEVGFDLRQKAGTV